MPFVSDLLTATPATVDGNPTPNRTWQWLRGSTPISGATSNIYTVQEADIGETISVRQTETNFLGSASALSLATAIVTAPDAYAIGGASPELVASFLTQEDGTTEGEYFRTAGAEDDFSMFSFSRASNATMFDSTGTLKWAPHNFVPSSNDFTVDWVPIGVTINPGPTAFGLSGTKLVSGSGQTRVEIGDVLPASAVPRRLRVIAKAAEWSWLQLSHDGPNSTVFYDLANGQVGAQLAGGVGEITPLGDGWYACDLITPNWWYGRRVFVRPTNGNNVATTGDGVSGVYILAANQWDDRLPMAANPDAPDAAIPWYVETTGATKYLPRRNAYYYNGTAWTKGGLQLESAAATNLVTYSRDLTQASFWDNNTGTVSSPDVNGWTSLSGSGSTEGAVVSRALTFTTNKFVMSFETEKSSGGWLYIRAGQNESSDYSAWLDITNGTQGASTGASVSLRVTDRGDRWFVEYIHPGAVGSFNLLDIIEVSGDGISNGSGSVTIKVRDVQLEDNASDASSHIPTNGSTVTRAAETLSIAGADTPANATAISSSMKGLITYADLNEPGAAYFYRWPVSQYELYLNTGSLRTGAVISAIRTPDIMYSETGLTEFSPGINLPYSLANAFATNTSRLASGGVLQSDIEEIGTIPDRSSETLNIGTKYNGFISELRMWGTDIGDSGVVEVTT